jgi:hypothetical protein
MKTLPTSQNPDIFKEIPFIKELNSTQLEALKFGLGATFYGTTGGLVFGGMTTLMRGIQDSPAGRANLLRSFKLFSKLQKANCYINGALCIISGIAGITYGLTGASLMIVNEEDSYTNRAIAGCSAGASLGIYSKFIIRLCDFDL